MASNSVGIDSSKDSSSRKSVSKRKEPDAKKRRFPKEVSAPSPTRLPEASNTPSQPIDSNSVATEGTNASSDPSVKTRSGVWDYFEKLKDLNGIDTGRCKCIYCGNTYGSKSESGTSALWKHLLAIFRLLECPP